VLSEIGYSDEAVAALHARRCIFDHRRASPAADRQNIELALADEL
jgi:hypothetical protein